MGSYIQVCGNFLKICYAHAIVLVNLASVHYFNIVVLEEKKYVIQIHYLSVYKENDSTFFNEQGNTFKTKEEAEEVLHILAQELSKRVKNDYN